MASEGSSGEISTVTDDAQAEVCFVLATVANEEPVLLRDDGAENSTQDLPEEVLQVPKYTTVFSGFLTTPEFSMDTGKHIANDVKPKRTCFNCLGDHNVQDCPEARDQRKISENRRALMANRPATSVRYHELFSSKYGNFTPGQLSPELRHALGCESHQLPEAVYRMRVLGYPPGWLMEAREQTGELALYGGDGRAVCQPGGEDGEVAGGAKYRSEKLIEFPGFNCPMPPGIKEENRWYNLPLMQTQHSLKHWREVMDRNRVTPYRKRKMRPENTGAIDAAPLAAPALDDSTSDGDIECIPVNSSSVTSERVDEGSGHETPEEGEVSSDHEMDDPHQSDLKRNHEDENGKGSLTSARKKAKGHSSTIELSDGDSTQGTITLDDTTAADPTQNLSSFIDTNPSPVADTGDAELDSDSGDDGLDYKPKAKRSKRATNGTSTTDAENPGTPTTTSTPAPGKKVKKHRRAGSKGFVLGAVIPQSITTYTKLPDFDNWTVDVTDHILFENLPDALGTWNNMRGLMNKVRSKMAEVHAEDD